jgi:hypothetical protein
MCVCEREREKREREGEREGEGEGGERERERESDQWWFEWLLLEYHSLSSPELGPQPYLLSTYLLTS